MTPEIAKPVLKKRKWPHSLIWILPALTAVGAGFYFRDYLSGRGREITIEFLDASGLREGESKLVYRGANIGKVTGIELSENHHHAIVHARLLKREDIFASRGASFWIVRPEVSEEGLRGLGTLLSGPYISAAPGKDEEEVTKFEGLSKEPRPVEEGERFLLSTSHLGHLEDGSPVYYRGIRVGTVQTIELSNEGDHLDVHILVWTRYAALVRQNTKFWVKSGFRFEGGIFSGIQLRLDSLSALISGGVAFATPDKDMMGIAKNGTHFVLEDDPKKEWEQWSPKIPISPRSGDAVGKSVQLPSTGDADSKKRKDAP